MAAPADQPAAPPAAEPAPGAPEHLVRLPRRLWKVVLGFGAAVWVLSAVVTQLTGDTILVPTVIVVGSFLVPTTMVAFALSRPREGHLTTEGVVLGFLGAGTLAVVATALLETYLVPAAAGTFLAVGVIEEIGKACVVVAVGTGLRRRAPRDGMVLGAVVGAGFAAFESAGYALQTMLDNIDDHTVRAILQTEASRALLAPFGHITWTALLGGALFASWQGGRLHVTGRLVGTAAGVILLHALWDQTYGTSITLAEGVTGAGWHIVWPNAQTWFGSPSAAARVWFNVFYDLLLALNAAVGATWIVHAWRGYGRASPAVPPTTAAPAAA
jgi:RsiW-degrading membrane proteinase PrsW (M82 family)